MAEKVDDHKEVRMTRREALALIERQKADIERLQGWHDLMKAEKHSLIKADGITEFAQKLKKRELAGHKGMVAITEIDNLVREMTGLKLRKR